MDGEARPGDEALEVRVQAIGPIDEGRWLARGLTADGVAVAFVTDATAAERIAAAMAEGAEPHATITRHQIVG